ncbi:UDP binding domain-containing protein [Chryseobacterium indoltheticum]|uniref:UDP binding domain-containing protein n=1 Tax=Chryseobacterium indoltheticum TaxID=254 RepID=UPI003F497CE8
MALILLSKSQKLREVGYYSELILAARRLNDSMGAFVASQVVKLMIRNDIKIKGARILNLGIAFKENCPDVRNTKAVDVIEALEEYGTEVITYDPWANGDEVRHEYNINFQSVLGDEVKESQFDAIVLTVAHQEFLDIDWSQYLTENGVLYDVKGVLKVFDRRL